ncbi:SpoIIIAH-like family protein [Rossellomorea vietnamensis]|uniref:SpoIIIAH-like family protein n=1 Tax=Rossellomorea vietnamensis TaxID=218284 RepID=A0A5D4MGQ6_9BACI|nr:SpoIIIAH-like family protein [Rossellomorea vietnamensis]TYS00697.1 SpoIIIAH-like family protein [Rossellomorea vietnamensis]
MLLKKQTVWLLTMLSLVIVLSVYYITSPTQQATDMAAGEEESSAQTEETSAENEEAAAEGEVDIVTEAAGDEVFETLRMEFLDQRSRSREELETKVASADLSIEEKNEAIEQMDKLKELATTETVLETMIKTMGYEDALVRADGEQVRITVKAKEHSAADANQIIRLVNDELGGAMQKVAVQFQPAN